MKTPTLMTDDMIMCCLIRAITLQGKMVDEYGMLIRKGKL
jgi:hypothetical protein